MMNKRLLVATSNPGKVREFRRLLDPSGAELVFPDELGIHLDIVEDGETYEANALQKAQAYARATGLLALADDSGLEVDALGGAPGVHSARYAGGSDAERAQALLRALGGVPANQRGARFRCVIVVAAPEGELCCAEGVCEGIIAQEPAGTGGFGYDPVFYLSDFGCTMAQLPAAEKNRISHRARAAAALIPKLRPILESSHGNCTV